MKPNWQSIFQDLPEIPFYKQWKNNSQMTVEQEIALKLLNKQKITEGEELIFKKLLDFYKALEQKLISLDYTTFNEEEFENFKNYLFYAFNFIPQVSQDLTIFSTYRVIVNEAIIKSNTRINHIDFLKYPTLEIVKKIGKFNRANTTETNVFYSAEDIDTALKEIRPEKGKLVTVGIWKPKENRKFRSYPISHSDSAKKNNGVIKVTSAFDDIKPYNSPLLVQYIENYLKIFGREYSKPVDHHYEYAISALFSERLLYSQNEPYEGIIYPSVGNDFKTDNIALHPSVLDEHFKLDKIMEFEISETFYDDKSVADDAEDITLADIKNVSITQSIDANGNIIW